MRSPLVGGLSVILAYMALRAVIYRLLPAYSASDWFAQDAWMTLPRFGGFVALLFMNRVLWKRFELDVDLRRYQRAVLSGIPLIGLDLWALVETCGHRWPPYARIGALFTTPFVGVFEEYACRGVVLQALLANGSTLNAIALSSLLFTIYHVEARPLSAWPAIFLTGVVLANYRIRGLSIFWLAIIHTVIDTIYFFFATDLFPTYVSLPDHLIAVEELPACASHDAVILSALFLLGVITYPRGSATGAQARS